MHYLKGCIIPGLLLGILSLAQPFFVSGEAMKTYLKQYSFFTFEGQDYLCEPYQVKKDDWLYKIFRQKGEISAEDFPKFLKIFKRLNPKLSNIDAIEPGHQILIPLKQVSRKAYEEKEKGIVEVPVLEFSTDDSQEKLAALIQKHTIQRGDTVSTLLDKAFLKKGGAVSDTGKKVFRHLNPDVRDIDRIYLGSRVLIPDPAILGQPWFQAFLATGKASVPLSPGPDGTPPKPLPTLPEIAPEDLLRLKRYAQLVQGALQYKGKMVFPGRSDGRPQVLDLEKTPVLTDKDGRKTLILPPETPADALNTDLVEGMKLYWKELRIQELNHALAKGPLLSSPTLNEVPEHPDHLIQTVLKATSFSFQPPTPVSVKVGTLDMAIDLARIIHDTHPDILINPGTVYGTALAALKDKGYEVVTLSPGMTASEILLLIFSKLGYATWKDPAFNAGGRVTLLKGIYASREKEKLFVTRSALSDRASAYMAEEGITAIELDWD